MKGSLFFAKILLFGEYGIIKDSKGLSIPYNFFWGTLKCSELETNTTLASHQILCDYADYLKTLSTDLLQLDWKRLLSDLDHKLEIVFLGFIKGIFGPSYTCTTHHVNESIRHLIDITNSSFRCLRSN